MAPKLGYGRLKNGPEKKALGACKCLQVAFNLTMFKYLARRNKSFSHSNIG